MTVTSRHMVATFRGVDLPTSLSWDTENPHAVRMVVHTSKQVEWWLAWDLLCEGRAAPAGIGDVHVRPVGDRVEIVLYRGEPNETALSFPGSDVTDFLASTWCMEPAPISDDVLAAFLAAEGAL